MNETELYFDHSETMSAIKDLPQSVMLNLQSSNNIYNKFVVDFNIKHLKYGRLEQFPINQSSPQYTHLYITFVRNVLTLNFYQLEITAAIFVVPQYIAIHNLTQSESI